MKTIAQFVVRMWTMMAVAFFAQPDPDTPQSATGPYPTGAAVKGGAVGTAYDAGFTTYPDTSNPNLLHVSKSKVSKYAVDGAITQKEGTIWITKGSAAALTLAAPTAGDVSAGGDDGKRLRIISNTAFAHVVTTPANKIQDGSTTTKDTLTFAAHAGALAELEAVNGSWQLVIGSTVASAVATEV